MVQCFWESKMKMKDQTTGTRIAAALMAGCAIACAAQAAPRPNIVFILADDLGWADLPAYGNRFNEAPNLNRLAAEGMRFTDAYAACPVCSPTRASIQSGQYPARVGVIDFIPGHWRPYERVTVPKNRTQYLPDEIVTVAEALKSAGYATGLFGKWHLGEGPKHHPLTQGYDEANVGQGYFNVRFDPPREDSADKVMPERLTDFGIDFIRRHKDRPFFLFLSHWSVHCLLDAGQPQIEKYLKKPAVEGYPCNAVYAAAVEEMDHSIGRVLDALKQNGLDDNTLVVFFSDNGGVIKENRYLDVSDAYMPMIMPSKQDVYRDSPLRYIVTGNLPLRGEKGTLFEGGIREPLMVRWPGKIKPATVSSALTTSVDFFPTFLELAGAARPQRQPLDGASLVPALLGEPTDPDRAVFWHYPVYHHDVPAAAVRKGQWKLIENLESGGAALYHLGSDLGETTDLSAAFPAKTKALRELLQRWQAEVGAQMPAPNPAFDAQRRLEWGAHPDRLKN